MKYSAKFIVPLILIFFVTGCSMFRTQQSGTLFTFNYEGKTYEIAGYTNSEGESANYLTYRENGSIVFRAVDNSRSGIIDQVISGSISKMEANKIYRAGIQIAMEKDLFKNIQRNRTFEVAYNEYQLLVETYQKRKGEFHNRFILFDLNWELIGSFWDDDSDGNLDRTESGDVELDFAQNLYSIALERAGESDRLHETDDNQRIISKNSSRNSEVAGVPE